VRSRLQYPLSFWLGAVMLVLSDLGPLLLLGIVFTRFPTIRGWHWRDIALLYGLGQLTVALMRCLATQLDHFDDYIASGDFDSFLIRPLPPLFHLLAARFEILHASRVLCAVVILTCAARAARVALTPAHLIVFLAVAAFPMGALFLLLATYLWHAGLRHYQSTGS